MILTKIIITVKSIVTLIILTTSVIIFCNHAKSARELTSSKILKLKSLFLDYLQPKHLNLAKLNIYLIIIFLKRVKWKKQNIPF